MNYNPEITRKRLAYLTGIPVQTINRAIQRNSRIYLKEALKIAKAFNKPVEYFWDEPVILADETISESQNQANEKRNYESHLLSKYKQLLDNCESIDETQQHMVTQLAKSLADSAPKYESKKDAK